MEVYHVTEDDLERVPEAEVEYERSLEKKLVRTHAASIGGEEILYISRQQDPSGDQTTFDLVGVDSRGNTIVLELKRGRTPREVVAQALDYASGLRQTEYEQLEDWYLKFRQQHGIETPATDSLREAHAEYFNLDEPLSEREFNQNQRLLLLADQFDDKTLSVADFLRNHEIDVICVTYQSFHSENGPQLLTTEAVRRPLHQEPQGLDEDDSASDPQTEAAEQRVEFWKGVNTRIGDRADSTLNNGWEPKNYTWYNIGFAGSDVPIQAACKIREAVVEMRLVIRDDAELFDWLSSQRQEVENAIESSFTADMNYQFDIEWISPDESDASKERGKFIIRRPIDLDDNQDCDRCESWIVDAGETFMKVFTKQFDVSDTT